MCIFLPAWPISFLGGIYHLPWAAVIAIATVSWLLGLQVVGISDIWVDLYGVAYGLADNAVQNLNDSVDSEESQVTETYIRNIPPRLFYATAVARRGSPVIMYRGWKFWDQGDLTAPEMSKSPGFACRKLRKL